MKHKGMPKGRSKQQIYNLVNKNANIMLGTLRLNQILYVQAIL